MSTQTAARTHKAGRPFRESSVGKKLAECESTDEMFKIASRYTGESVASLKRTYGHLPNIGLVRMNLGNRMRGAVRATKRAISH